MLVELSGPLSLEDAVDIAEGRERPVVGYRFENDGVVGEYFPNGEDPDLFQARFFGDFGMDPTIIGLVEQVETARDPREAGSEMSPQAITVPQARTMTQPQSSRSGQVWDELAHGRDVASEQSLLQEEVEVDLPSESTVLDSGEIGQRAAIELDWQYTFGRFGLRNRGSSPQMANIYQEYIWSEPTQSPLFRDLNTALEFEINQHNMSWILGQDTQGYQRPNCIPNVSEHYWATNRGFTWGVVSPYGFASQGIGAYADTNDLSDFCSVQSMAVGISNPGNVNDDGYGTTQMAIWIDANRGNVASQSHVSGTIQAVEKLSCDNAPWNGAVGTDCVGLNYFYTYNGEGESAYGTLQRNRDAWAPTLCWMATRHKMQMEPGKPADTYHPGSCDAMFGPMN